MSNFVIGVIEDNPVESKFDDYDKLMRTLETFSSQARGKVIVVSQGLSKKTPGVVYRWAENKGFDTGIVAPKAVINESMWTPSAESQYVKSVGESWGDEMMTFVDMCDRVVMITERDIKIDDPRFQVINSKGDDYHVGKKK